MTTRVIYGEEDRLLPWAAARIGIERFRRDAYCIGLEKDGEIVAVAVYDCFSSAECNVHLASDGSRNWMNREFLVRGFSYPFLQCGFESITGIVPADNEPALRFNEHIGWTRCGYRQKAAAGGGDIVIMEMLKTDCKWIPKEMNSEQVPQ